MKPSRLLLTPIVLAVTAPLQAQTWRADYDQSAATYQTLFNLRVAQGYRPVSISARQATSGGDRFEILWTKTQGVAWTAIHGRTAANYQSQLTALGRVGFRPTCVDTYRSYPNELYVAIFVKDTTVWSARHRLTAVQYQTEFNTHNTNKFRALSIGASGSGSSTRYAGVWVKPQAGYAAAHNRTLSSLRTQMATWKARGGRVLSFAAAGTASSTRFAATWDFPRTTTREFVGQTLAQLQSTTASLAKAGYRPLAVTAYDTASGPRYLSSWTLDSAAKTWTETGIPVAGMKSFDGVMRSYMQAEGISQGALAVTRGSKLVFARGYTWAPKSVTPTDPQSLFRLASLSKAVTAVGVLRLVQKGKIKLDQKVSTILDMRGWTDARARDITVRQLLQHWGGFDRSRSGDPMFKDRTVSSTLRRPLPTTPQMIVDYMKGQRLDWNPGAVYAYSNFGFSLLGRILEAVDKSSYEDFMQREVFLPIGASSFRVTDSLRGRQIRGEVEYDDPRTGLSVMGAGSPTTVQFPYGVWNIRSLDAPGGLVANVIDYARFLTAFDNKNTSPLLSRAMIDEMWKRPPGGSRTSPVYMGMGWLVRQLGSGRINTWHNGSLDGTYTIMVKRSDGLNWVAFFNKRTGNSGSIDGLLHQGANGVTAWPSHDLFKSYGSVSTFQIGCRGKHGLPYIRPEKGNIARIGFPFALEIQPIGASTTANRAVLYLGASRTRWNGVPLPLSLSLLGMSPCTLNISPDLAIALPNLGGRARFAGTIPSQSALIGRVAWMQGMISDPGTNPLGAITTPGSQVQFGRQ